jgi:hypothetical protein
MRLELVGHEGCGKPDAECPVSTRGEQPEEQRLTERNLKARLALSLDQGKSEHPLASSVGCLICCRRHARRCGDAAF